MTTEKKPEETATPETNDNKTLFGPLGKYAAVAVIMVGVIVTTALMLDRQLNTVEEQLAIMETEAAAVYETHSAATAEATTEVETTTASTEIKEEIAKEETVSEPIVVATVTPVEESTVKVLITQETIASPVATETNHNTAQTASATTAQFEMATAKNSAKARQAKLAEDYQVRIDANKAEQKKNMSEMFARIKALESQQLGRYKANQNDQIVRLRKQITHQNQMIETLVLRNDDLYKMRSANVQRNQANREQVLNRI